MSSLTELLRDVAEDQPADGFTDPVTLTALGRGRLRRRRRTAGLIAAAVAALMVAPFAIRAASGPEPVPPTGKVIRLDKAVPGVAGRDWTTLSSPTNVMLNQGPGRLGVQGTLQDGRLVVSRLVGRHERDTGDGVLDPKTGSVRWFPSRRVGLYLGHEGSLLVYGTPYRGNADPYTAPDIPYSVYNLATGAWRSLPANRDLDLEWGGSLQSQVVSDGMLYVAGDTTPHGPLWRVALDGSTAWERAGTVAAFGVGSGTLAYTAALGPDPGTLTLRDLATGHETHVPASPNPGCWQENITVSTAYVVRQLSCGRPPTGLVNQLRVLDHQGKQLASVSAGYLELSAVSDSLVVFSVPGEPDNAGYPPGTYAYHPASGRLVRLGTHAVDRFPFLRPADPVQLWHSGLEQGGRRPGAVRFDVVLPH